MDILACRLQENIHAKHWKLESCFSVKGVHVELKNWYVEQVW
jgi:hypothetical protein